MPQPNTARTRTPRSEAIEKSWRNLDWPSVFAAVIYPALGVLGIVGAVALGLALGGVSIKWWFAGPAFASFAITLVLCNWGIGVLHRIWQHKAGELGRIANAFTALNCVVAMQGSLRDWVNYHSQHHRLSDKPGDPHNPHESKFWAWIGWLLWRDRDDLGRPLALWLRDNGTVQATDKHYYLLCISVHLALPAAMYALTWALGGSLLLAFLIHASAVTARGVQFHATTLGVNVLGHLPTPQWLDWFMALMTGGEAIHDHHHEYPASVLHLPRKGLINRIFDYNGSLLLLFSKLGWAKNLQVAPQFETEAAG